MLTHMEVFNKYIMPATIETLGQMIAKFNEASGGTIILSTEGFEGDFMQESFWAGIHSAGRRVDRYAANADVAAVDLSQLKLNAVKVAGGIGPVRFEPGQLSWLQKPTAEAIEVASRNFAEIMLQDQLNTSIACLVAAIGNVAGATNDVSATASMSYSALNDGHAKFGDRSASLTTNIYDGTTFHKLIGNNLANVERLYSSNTVNVVDILGKRAVVTDAPALSEAGKLKALTLTAGAALVSDGGDVISNIETTNGKQRIETTLQTDYTFGVGLKGFSWDTANGGKSPDDAALATGSNWDKTVADVKHTAGVLTVTDDS